MSSGVVRSPHANVVPPIPSEFALRGKPTALHQGLHPAIPESSSWTLSSDGDSYASFVRMPPAGDPRSSSGLEPSSNWCLAGPRTCSTPGRASLKRLLCVFHDRSESDNRFVSDQSCARSICANCRRRPLGLRRARLRTRSNQCETDAGATRLASSR